MEAVWDLIKEYLPQITSFILGIGVIAVVITKFKAILKGLIGILKEAVELLSSVLEALNDGKLTKAEIDNIVKEFNDLIAKAKDLVTIFKTSK